MTSQSVGSSLRELRSRSKLGIKSAAPKAGITYSYLSKIENDSKMPSDGVILKLCALYQADPEEVIAKTGGLPSDIREIIRKYGKEAFNLLREKFGQDDRAGT